MTSLFTNFGHQTAKHRLDPTRIIQTAENLANDVGEKLPGSTLAGLAAELTQIARDTDARVKQAARPIYPVKILSFVAIAAAIIGPSYVLEHLQTRWEFDTITDFFEAADAGFNLIVLLAGALWFLFTFEARMKRNRTLMFIGELREFIHVIDVTQLYYTPDLYHADAESSRSSLDLDYSYLFVCTQMLGVISNLAALHTRCAPSDSILRAASEVETLASSIATKLVSKTETVRVMSATAGN